MNGRTYIKYFLFSLIVGLIAVSRYIAINNLGWLTLDDRLNNKPSMSSHFHELFRGDKISVELASRFPNLGIVGIRFKTHYRLNTDVLEFRIKEASSPTWYYTAKYNTDQFQPNEIFPFGFPLISDSQGKTYLIEIESQKGSPGNMVSIDDEYPSVLGRHVFTLESLVKNPILLFRFISLKLANLTEYPGFSQSTLIFFSPVLFILLFKATNYFLLISLPLMFYIIYWDIFQNRVFYDFLYFSVIFSWWVISAWHKLGSRVSGLISLLLILLITILIPRGGYLQIEKNTSWAVFFLLFAFIQHFRRSGKINEFDRGVKFILREIFSEARSLLLVRHKFSKSQTATIKNSLSKIASYIFENQLPRWQVNVTPTQKQVNLAIIIGSWAIFAYLVYSIARHFYQYYHVFLDYFYVNQLRIFFERTGTYLVLVLILAILSFIYLSRKLYFLRRIFLAIIIAAITLQIESYIYARTTGFKELVTIWEIRTNDLSEAWADVHVIGRNFQNPPHQGRIFVDAIEQRVIRWADKEIIFRTNPQYTPSGKLYVITHDGKISNEL